ncbi:MAG TPA: response regulator, partial [Emticicia sp.]
MTKVLYVEDEPFLGKIVKESLESRNFKVEMVADGNLVLKAFEQFKPDICVLDVMLPNKDGYTLGNEIRQIKPNLPIVFLTAKTQTDDVLKGFQSGGNDYIRKPFSMEELIVRINNLLLLSNSKGITPTGSISLGKY